MISMRQVLGIAIAVFGTWFTAGMDGGFFAKLGMAIAFGAASGYVATGTLRGAVTGAFTAGLTFGVGWAAQGWNVAAQVAAQAVTGGVIESLQGGNFGHGFAAAGLTAAFMPQAGHRNTGVRAVRGALIGGTISAATGGKFANGAISGAIQGAMAGGGDRLNSADGNSPANPETAAMAAAEANQAVADAGINDRIEAGGYRSGRRLARDWGKAVYPISRKYNVELGVRVYRGRYGNYALGPTGSSGAYDWVSVPGLPKLGAANYRWTGVAHTHPAVSYGHMLSDPGLAYGGTFGNGDFYFTGAAGDIGWAINNQKNIYVYGGQNPSLTSWSYHQFAASHSQVGQRDHVCRTTSPPQC